MEIKNSMSRIIYMLALVSVFLSSCKESKKENISHLVEEWIGAEIAYPANMIFTLWGKDTVDNMLVSTPYTIVTYADSTGCIGCKLQLANWMAFIRELKESKPDRVKIYFIFYLKEPKEMAGLLKRNRFNYPVCIDVNDSFNKLNRFPSAMAFQTVLLDRDNKVVAIGNPAHNSKIKELYMDIIQGGEEVLEERFALQTEVSVNNNVISLGTFYWKEEQTVSFTLKNTGKNPLVIEDVTTSCGCTSVEYSKEPVRAGKDVSLYITYKADYPEHFNKMITVYCNAVDSPLRLTVWGDAETDKYETNE